MSLLLAGLLAATALQGTLDLSDRSQVGARAGSALGGPTLDVETSPEVKLGIESRRWTLTASYAPRFTASVAGSDPQSYVVQQGRLGARFQDRRGSLALSQDTGYGRLSLLTLGASAGATPLGALPPTEIIAYAWSRTGLVARLFATRRWALRATGELSLSGGAGALAEASLPFQTALRGGIGAEYAASRRDRLSTMLDASRAVFSTGLEDALVEGKVSWKHDLDRGLSTTLAGGIGWSTSSADTAPPGSSTAAPIVEAGLTYRPRASTLDLELTAKIAPGIDAVSGRIDQRVDGTASVAWTPARDLAIQGQLGVGRAIPWGDGVPLSLGFGALTLSYHVNDVLQIDGGGRSAWVQAPGIDAPPQWMAFAGATLRIPTVRF